MEKLDNLDKKILSILSKNARIAFKDVAEACDVSRAAVHQRVPVPGNPEPQCLRRFLVIRIRPHAGSAVYRYIHIFLPLLSACIKSLPLYQSDAEIQMSPGRSLYYFE